MPGKKVKTILKGYLSYSDVKKLNMNDPTFKEYWNRVKDNLFIFGDEEKIYFLNNEFKEIAKKYEGKYLKITIEEIPYVPKEKQGLPDMDKEYQGFEKFKRQIFHLFKIS